MSGKGADLGHIAAMLQDVLVAQEQMRRDLGQTRVTQQETQAELRSLRAEHGRKLDDLAGQVADLRQTVTQYHASVLGHGILISDLEARVRRIEHHLDLPPAA